MPTHFHSLFSNTDSSILLTKNDFIVGIENVNQIIKMEILKEMTRKTFRRIYSRKLTYIWVSYSKKFLTPFSYHYPQLLQSWSFLQGTLLIYYLTL